MTAHCDIATGKIYGCEKFSREWWHEKGHLEYNLTELSGNLKVLQSLTLFIWMLSVTMGLLNKFMFLISLPTLFFYIGVDIYEERWCNRYAKLNFKRGKNDSKKSSKSS